MKNDISLAGKTFYQLTLVEKESGYFWRCQCSCGNVVSRRVHDVIRGATRSCGCLKSRKTSERNKANALHGLSNTPTGVSWNMALNRCYNKNIPVYATYGAVGIRMCEYLRATPINLIEVIGLRPKGKTIDRIKNAGNYSCGKCAECIERGWPLNVRWATPTEQGRNQRTNRMVNINGLTKCLAQWADDSGIPYSCLGTRVRRGWPEYALLLPVGTFGNQSPKL